MTPNSEPSTGTVTGRVRVPEQLRYAGGLPEQLIRPEPPVRESSTRNMVVTFVVVLAIAAATAYVFRPAGAEQTATWHSAPTATATPTDEPRYDGPPPSGEPMPVGDLPGWRQTFTEDFNGADLSERWWIYDGQPNGDPGGWFMPSHVSQQGGRLIINGSREDTPNGNLYATGGISNSKSFSQTYGKFSIRFRMDPGYGINYIILLWPTDDRWPPELNIAEDNGKDRTRLTSTIHYGGHGQPSRYTSRERLGVDVTQWHTVGVEWTPGRAVMLLDGQEWARYESDVVPRTAMSLAIQTQAWFCGGNFSDCPNATTPANVNMEVDWAVAYAMA